MKGTIIDFKKIWNFWSDPDLNLFGSCSAPEPDPNGHEPGSESEQCRFGSILSLQIYCHLKPIRIQESLIIADTDQNSWFRFSKSRTGQINFLNAGIHICVNTYIDKKLLTFGPWMSAWPREGFCPIFQRFAFLPRKASLHLNSQNFNVYFSEFRIHQDP